MKKLLLVSTALVGVAMMSAPASAAVKLGLGGYFSTYGVYADNNEPAGTSLRKFDWRADRELFVLGSTTLDNGLTVGVNYEMDLGGAVQTDEAYIYFSGGWGRLNVGAEDGAAFLLQVAAPSGDSNIDGMQTTMQAFGSQDALFSMTTNGLGLKKANLLDYEHVSSSNGLNSDDRLTYLTPKFSGFQAGVSYAPQDLQAQGQTNNILPMAADNTIGAHDQVWEGALRWDGEFQGLGIAIGGGYSHAALQAKAAAPTADATPTVSAGLATWSGGTSLAWSGFSLGGSYQRETTKDQNGLDPFGVAPLTTHNVNVTMNTWLVGLGYDNGPWHLGTSYIKAHLTRGADGVAADDGEIQKIDATVHRYTVGSGYTFGPGMTFNGSVSWGAFDNKTSAVTDAFQTGVFAGAAATSNDFTQVTLGTNIQF